MDVMGAWPLLAGLLVVGLSLVLGGLFISGRRRVRYRLRNRLTPLTVLDQQPAPIERRVRWYILGAVALVTLALLIFRGYGEGPG